MFVRQIPHEFGTPCLLVGCVVTRLGVIVDPVAETWRFYEEILRAERITLSAVVGSQPGRLRATILDETEAEPAWPCIRIRCTAQGQLKVGFQSSLFLPDAPNIEVEDGRIVTEARPSAGGVDLRFGTARLRLRPELRGEGFRLITLMPPDEKLETQMPEWVGLRSSGKAAHRLHTDADEILEMPREPGEKTDLPAAERSAAPPKAARRSNTDLGQWLDLIETATPAPVRDRAQRTDKGRP